MVEGKKDRVIRKKDACTYKSYTTLRSHLVSSCTCPHRKSQYEIPHFLHRYAPLYPHTEHHIRGGTGGGGAAAVRYDGCVGPMV